MNLIAVGEFDAGGNLLDGGGQPTDHPLTRLPVTGTPGEQFFVAELPFGSFVPAQTPATITIDAATDRTDGAVVGTPLTISANGGLCVGL